MGEKKQPLFLAVNQIQEEKDEKQDKKQDKKKTQVIREPSEAARAIWRKEKSERKPTSTHILEDGRDPDPVWDTVARALWPATKENQTHREALANALMYACYDDTVIGAAQDSAVIMARMVQNLMGRPWMDRWLRDNYFNLSRRVTHNRSVYGGKAQQFLRKLFS